MPRRRQITTKLVLTIALGFVIFGTIVFFLSSEWLRVEGFEIDASELRTLAIELCILIAFLVTCCILEREAIDARRQTLLGRHDEEASVWKEAAGTIRNRDKMGDVISDFTRVLETAFEAPASKFRPDDSPDGALSLIGSWFWGDRALERLRGELERYVTTSLGKEMLPQLRDRLELAEGKTLGSMLTDLLRLAEHKLDYDRNMEKLGEISRRIKLKKPANGEGKS
jgi:hypothetical protein